jgi:hypothetical protein
MAAAKIENVGLLLVHGIGEQKKLEHLRCTAAEFASALSSRADLVRMAMIDKTGDDLPEIIIDTVLAGGKRHVRFHLHEVWWADLGFRGGFLEQARFWSWGLGQWAEETFFRLKPRSNTKQMMALPRFDRHVKRTDRPNIRRRIPARFALFGAAWLALLTLLSWSLAKRLVSFFSNRLPDPALIVMFLGDVRNYSRGGGPGRGTLEDPDLPVRTTIRRRMVSAMVDIAAAQHDRWYVMAHSLGSVLAFNALQEIELALPNYLTEKHWERVPEVLKTTSPYVPPDATPNIDQMMPRRPTWLNDGDGISREALFAKLRGFVTYGCPLDKFAALWPKIVPLNRQSAVFPEGAEWLNLYDATDPVAGSLDAFPPIRRHQQASPETITLKPDNVACRASGAFLLSHIRYFTPRRRKAPGKRRNATLSVPAAIFDAIADNASLSKAAHPIAVGKAGRTIRRFGAFLQVLIVSIILAVTAAVLISIAAQLVGWNMTACPKITDLARVQCRDLVWLRFQLVLGATGSAVFIAGAARALFFDLIAWLRS